MTSKASKRCTPRPPHSPTGMQHTVLFLPFSGTRAGRPSRLVPLLPCCLRALLLPPPPADRMLLSPSPGPTNAEVATGIAGIWKAVPKIQIEVVSIFTCGEAKSCVANIKVIVDETTTTLTLNPKPSP